MWRLVCSLAAGGSAAAALLVRLAGSWLQIRPVVLGGEGLQERLAAVPRRALTEVEVETFRRDGVLLLRGYVPDQQLLLDMLPALQRHQQIDSAMYLQPWLYNDVANVLLESGVLTGPAMQIHTRKAQLQQAPIFGTAGQGHFKKNAWHQDFPAGPNFCDSHMISAWLAITEAPHGLEVFRGSHDCDLRVDMVRQCNTSWMCGKACERILDDRCMRGYARRVIDPRLGYSSHFWVDMAAGDMILFDGNTAHRGFKWPRSRTAVSVRVVANRKANLNYMCSEAGTDLLQPGQGPLDLPCLQQWLLPRPYDLWPKWAGDRLPPGNESSSTRWLRWAVAGLGGVLLPS